MRRCSPRRCSSRSGRATPTPSSTCSSHRRAVRVLEGHPAIRELFAYDRRALVLGPLEATLQRLRARDYDVVVNCANWSAPSVSAAIIARLAGRRRRCSGRDLWPVRAMHTHPVAPRPGSRSEVVQRVHLLSPLPGAEPRYQLTFRPPKVVPSSSRSSPRCASAPHAVVNPGGRLDWRRVPHERVRLRRPGADRPRGGPGGDLGPGRGDPREPGLRARPGLGARAGDLDGRARRADAGRTADRRATTPARCTSRSRSAPPRSRSSCGWTSSAGATRRRPHRMLDLTPFAEDLRQPGGRGRARGPPAVGRGRGRQRRRPPGLILGAKRPTQRARCCEHDRFWSGTRAGRGRRDLGRAALGESQVLRGEGAAAARARRARVGDAQGGEGPARARRRRGLRSRRASAAATGTVPVVDLALVRSTAGPSPRSAREIGAPDDVLRLQDLVSQQGVIRLEERSVERRARRRPRSMQALDRGARGAPVRCAPTRGRRSRADLTARLALVEAWRREIEKLVPEPSSDYRHRLDERIAELAAGARRRPPAARAGGRLLRRAHRRRRGDDPPGLAPRAVPAAHRLGRAGRAASWTSSSRRCTARSTPPGRRASTPRSPPRGGR